MSMIGGVGGYSATQYTRPNFQPPTLDSLDSDKNGALSLDELKAGAPKGTSDSQAQKRAEALFSAMDSDADGSVSSAEKDAFDSQMAERVGSMAFMAQQMQAPSAADIFAQTDADQDGSVSLEEFGAEATEQSSETLQKLFDLIDGDGDGTISEAEGVSFLETLKGEMDSARGAGGPPPGGPPPGGPPPGGGAEASATGESEDDEDESTSSVSLLTMAQAAYGASQSTSLLDQLASIFNEAA
ncbi:MAG: EF-hand domain-containing protein [Devosia sp.]|uniref:EF-hand domain-containing protein n=1 Tax=Devosia sp. TaxID=1871048 RepID=UPI0024C5DC8D|nr:EF-hand domain-containing protein [Devosia sp.]UYN99482.1 MAG: EF-hand domain-containing protein [Devosia sp.]